MIVGPDGKQVSDGLTGRKIIITEQIVKGQPRWGVDGCESLDVFEAVQVLSEVIRAIVVTERQIFLQHKIKEQVKDKLDDLAKGSEKA